MSKNDYIILLHFYRRKIDTKYYFIDVMSDAISIMNIVRWLMSITIWQLKKKKYIYIGRVYIEVVP